MDKLAFRPEDYSDAGNATVFEKTFREQALWTRGGGWFVWDGMRWRANDQAAVKLARMFSSAMLEEACILLQETENHTYLDHAVKTRRVSSLNAMLQLAQSGLMRELIELDADPFDLNTPGGIIDLRTGETRPHDPKALCTRITGATPGDEGRELWNELLNTITQGDDKLINFHQQVAGMALIGKVFHEGIIIAVGGGRNGKSTFYNALGGAFGDYAGYIAVSALTNDRGNKGASLATLRGRRLALTGELEECQRLSVATLKQLASTDMLVAEEKYKAPEAFRQSHTICLFTNHMPRVGSTDGG